MDQVAEVMPKEADADVHGRARPGGIEFRLLISASMSMSALAIDLMLPSFPRIREDFGLAEGSSSVSLLVTVFLLGLAIGQIPWGLASDRFGRRPILRTALIGVALAAALAAVAPTLATMLVARFVWGLAAAGMRVAATASVRDAYVGERMAREMSFVMAVFFLVPVIAPSVGALIAHFVSWRFVFWFCVIAAGAVLTWSSRFPETQPVHLRRPVTVQAVAGAGRAVRSRRDTTLLMLAATLMFGAFNVYLSTSQSVIDEVFGLGPQFPLIFGAVAATMGVAMLGNGRLVMGLGLTRVIGIGFVGYLVGGTILVLLSLTRHGRPAAALFLPVLGLTIASHGVLLPNLNAAALRPMGALAGTAAAVVGTVSMLGGSVIGALLSGFYDRTSLPLSLGFVGCGALAAALAGSALRRPVKATVAGVAGVAGLADAVPDAVPGAVPTAG